MDNAKEKLLEAFNSDLWDGIEKISSAILHSDIVMHPEAYTNADIEDLEKRSRAWIGMVIKNAITEAQEAVHESRAKKRSSQNKS